MEYKIHETLVPVWDIWRLCTSMDPHLNGRATSYNPSNTVHGIYDSRNAISSVRSSEIVCMNGPRTSMVGLQHRVYGLPSQPTEQAAEAQQQQNNQDYQYNQNPQQQVAFTTSLLRLDRCFLRLWGDSCLRGRRWSHWWWLWCGSWSRGRDRGRSRWRWRWRRQWLAFNWFASRLSWSLWFSGSSTCTAT